MNFNMYNRLDVSFTNAIMNGHGSWIDGQYCLFLEWNDEYNLIVNYIANWMSEIQNTVVIGYSAVIKKNFTLLKGVFPTEIKTETNKTTCKFSVDYFDHYEYQKLMELKA